MQRSHYRQINMQPLRPAQAALLLHDHFRSDWKSRSNRLAARWVTAISFATSVMLTVGMFGVGYAV
jgi:hypothetical protein